MILAAILFGASLDLTQARPTNVHSDKIEASSKANTGNASASKNARPADWAARDEHALALAKAMQPEDLVIGSAMQTLTQGLGKSLSQNPEIQKIEKQHPGFTVRYSAAALPELERLFRSRMPILWQRLGEALAMEMTVAELDQATHFYSGPVGQKFLRLTADNMDSQPLMDAGVKEGITGQKDPVAVREEMAKGARGSLFGALAAMSQAEREAYSEFLVSPAGAALTRAGPATSDVVVHWMDEDDPDASNAMAAVAKRVLQELDSARVNPGKAQ